MKAKVFVSCSNCETWNEIPTKLLNDTHLDHTNIFGSKSKKKRCRGCGKKIINVVSMTIAVKETRL